MRRARSSRRGRSVLTPIRCGAARCRCRPGRRPWRRWSIVGAASRDAARNRLALDRAVAHVARHFAPGDRRSHGFRPVTERVPYRPSNGTEGSWFESQWCSRCALQGNDATGFCEIQGSAYCGETPAEWTSEPGGTNPSCSAFAPIVPPAVVEACRERCAAFGDPPCFRAEPGCRPCLDCLAEAGEVLEEPLDPDAVIRPLL